MTELARWTSFAALLSGSPEPVHALPGPGTTFISHWMAAPTLDTARIRRRRQHRREHPKEPFTAFRSWTITARPPPYLCHSSTFVLHCSFSPSAFQEVLPFQLAPSKSPAGALELAASGGFVKQALFPSLSISVKPPCHVIPEFALERPLQPRGNHRTHPAHQESPARCGCGHNTPKGKLPAAERTLLLGFWYSISTRIRWTKPGIC